MNVQCALWSPKDVLTSDDQDQRPKLFIRYKSSASPDGALALAIAYPYDKVNVTNQQRNGLELTDGFPEWGELAIRERRT